MVIPSLNCQNLYADRRDSIFVKDRFKVSIIHNKDSLLFENIIERPYLKYNNIIMTDLDSIQDILQNNFIYDTYLWDSSATPYIKELLCDDGFRIFLDTYSPSQIRYFPVERVVDFGKFREKIYYTFSLTDGEMTYPPDRLLEAANQDFRWCILGNKNSYDEIDRDIVLQGWNKKSEEYVELLQLSNIISDNYYINYIDWVDDVFYFFSSGDLWLIKVETFNTDRDE